MLKTKPKKRIFLFVAVAALLVFLYQVRALGPAESLVGYILNPFFSGFHSAGVAIRDTYNEKLSKDQLVSLVSELQSENQRLIAETSNLKILEKENNELREYLNFLEARQFKYVMASIISRGELNEADTVMVIDKGENDGIKKGQAAVNSQGIVVGKVASVKGEIAEIYLITNKDCRLAASIQNENKTAGIVEGELGLSAKMNLIPQTEDIQKDDIIITSGLEGDIPKGLPIGKVERVEKENNDIWQSAVLEPLVDFDELTFLSIIVSE